MYVCEFVVHTGAVGKGVSVYLYADVLLRLAEGCGVDVCWLVMYKVRFKIWSIFRFSLSGLTQVQQNYIKSGSKLF